MLFYSEHGRSIGVEWVNIHDETGFKRTVNTQQEVERYLQTKPEVVFHLAVSDSHDPLRPVGSKVTGDFHWPHDIECGVSIKWSEDKNKVVRA